MDLPLAQAESGKGRTVKFTITKIWKRWSVERNTSSPSASSGVCPCDFHFIYSLCICLYNNYFLSTFYLLSAVPVAGVRKHKT